MFKSPRLALVILSAVLLAVLPSFSAAATTFTPDASNSVLGTWQTGGTVLKYYTGTANELTITMSAPKKQGYTTSMPMAHSATWGGATSLTTAYTPNANVVASSGLGIKYISTQLTAAERTTAASSPVAFDTVTFTFSRPVEDAVFHINNLGGFNAGSMYSQWKILDGLSMTKLSGQGNFMVDGGTIIKTINVPTVSTTGSTGTGSGSVQIPGIYTSVRFEMGLSCSSAAACAGTIPEGLAFQWSLPSVYVAPTTPTPTASPSTPPGGVAAVDDFATTNPVTPVDLDILTNDTLGDGVSPGTLKLCATGESSATCSVRASTTTADGTWALNTSTNKVTFTPVLGFFGDTTLPYVFNDLNNILVSAVMHVTVSAPPAISATNDSTTTTPVTPVHLSPLTNDTTGLGVATGSLKLCAGSQTGVDCIATTTTTSDGTWTLNTGTSVVTFSPAVGFWGTTTLPYVFQDDYAQVASAMLSVKVSAPPTIAATDDSAATGPVTPVDLTVLTNDTVGSGVAANTLKMCASGESGLTCSKTSVTTSDGTWVLNTGTNVVTFTPSVGFVGVTTLPYVFQDSNTQLATANMTVTVTDGRPAAADDTTSTAPGTPVTLSILANDFFGSGLAAGTVKLCATGETSNSCSVTTTTSTSDGTWVLNSAANTVTFTPAPGFSGVARLNYVFADTDANLVSAFITVTVEDPEPTETGRINGELPNTGMPLDFTLGVVGIALALGIALVVRRRRA